MIRAEVKNRDYRPGQEIDYWVATLLPNGSVSHRFEKSRILKVAGGGFFGRFLFLEGREYGIKTTQPTPLHALLRQAAWGFGEFPSQVSLEAAQEDHLALNLISDVLPVATGGKFYSPGSPGYTRLSTGYSQLVDEVRNGRPPRFYPVNEFAKFKEA
jgi:hypothetical protein